MKGGMGGEGERGEWWTRVSEVDEGRAGGGAEGCRDDSTACTAAAAAVIGSHHSSAVLTMSPPIYPDRLCACHFPSGRESEQQKERQ